MFNGTWLYAEHGKIISKGAVGAITKVGPTTSPVAGGHVSDHVGEHVSEHVEDAPLSIHLEPEKYDSLMIFCEQHEAVPNCKYSVKSSLVYILAKKSCSRC